MDGYNPNSCNALEKPFYRPVEAALRWCGLITHEADILSALHGGCDIPKTGQFCVFQTNLDTDSTGSWTVIPRQAGHRFQSKLDSQP